MWNVILRNWSLTPKYVKHRPRDIDVSCDGVEDSP